MKTPSVITSGLAGAAAVTAIHETIRRVYPKAPRLDLLGMQSLKKVIQNAGGNASFGNKLYGFALAADVLGNALYYSLSGVGEKKQVFAKGAVLGAVAGIGAVVLPKIIGLKSEYTNRSFATQATTVGLYVLGGIVTASVMYFMNRSRTEDLHENRSDYNGAHVIGYDEQ